jgi:hypothetical protein
LTASFVAIAQSEQPAPSPTPAPTVQLTVAVQPMALSDQLTAAVQRLGLRDQLTAAVQPLAPRDQLTAAVQPLALPEQPPLLDVLLNSPARLLGPAAPLGALPTPPAPAQFAIAPNLADTIDSVYIAVEPWVQYGFEVATAVVRWIPYVGWFAGQIMVFYNFFESMVASGVFNFTDWLRGDGGAIENLVDFGVDVGLAFAWLGLDELAQFVPLPPFCCYPPRPPVQGPFSTSQTLASPTETAESLTAAPVEDSTTPGPDGAEVVEGSEPDEIEQLGEDLSEEQGAGQDVTLPESEEDVNSDIVTVESDIEEAVETDDDFTEENSTETTSGSSGTVDAQSEADDSAAQHEVRSPTNGKTADSAKPADRNKKGDNATEAGATGSSTDSSATGADTGAKHANKGEKKDRTGKKDRVGKGDRHASART